MYEARLRDSLPEVEERIARALERAGRTDEVTIVLVTKGHPAEAARAALTVGLRELGENRVQELEQKRTEVSSPDLHWHLIGHLQRNKVRKALPLFELIHSLDSDRLGETLAGEGERVGREVRALVQVNTSGEAAKGGFDAPAVVDAVARLAEHRCLRLQGLMTMAPLTDDERTLRATFRRAHELWEECRRQVPGFQARHLSMGMSNDFEVAVEEGSTMVRLGTILLGDRQS